jgi:hypothetical protein
MKRTLLTFLIIVTTLAIGTYYTYVTDKGFNKYVSSLLHPRDTIFQTPQPSDQKATRKETKIRDSTPKKIKQDKFYRLDEFARRTPKQYEKDVQTLALYLVTPAVSDIEKVRVLFTWVATHVYYDVDAFNSGNLPDYPAERVLLTKKAVCDGYSNLLKELCDAAGLESEKIIGYAKGYGYKIGEKFSETDHAWNAVKIDNQWKLFDATWASGESANRNGKLSMTLKFDSYWFDVSPKEFIFTHLPEEPKWQLVENTMSIEKFEELPFLNDNFFKLRFDSDKIFDEAISGRVKDFVETPSSQFPVKAIQIPYTQDLQHDVSINFIIESYYAEDITLIDGNTWHSFKKQNNSFSLTHTPISNQIEISQKINWYDANYWTILKYKVVDNDYVGTH